VTKPDKTAPSIDIVAAMDHPRLFQPWFAGESWNGWRAVLKGAYGLPMTDQEIEFFRTVAERDPPKKRVRELWIIAGRRAGKDSVASMIAAHSAALFDGQDRLRPGERALVACIAFDKDQAKIVLNYAKAYFGEVPLFANLMQNDSRVADFELSNGVDVSVMANNFRAIRGRPILCAILDEIAIWRDENSAAPDVETYNAIKPGLVTLAPASMIVGISSPYRKSGLLYAKFKKHFGRDDDHTLVIRAPTRSLNPTVPQEEIDRDLEEDPAKARAEWLAEFRDDIGGWLPLEVIEQAVDRGLTVRPPSTQRRVYYKSFCDPSGGAKDSFTAAIAHEEAGIAVLDCILEIKAPFNPTSAAQQIANLLKSYNITSTVGDRYGAQWIVDGFAAFGIRYQHSERDRSAIYLDAMPLFTSGRVRLLDNKRLTSQFAGLERRTSSIGKDKVDHGPGGSDDVANAAAGALVRAIAEPAQASRRAFVNFMER
jgi:hypothetical protein